MQDIQGIKEDILQMEDKMGGSGKKIESLKDKSRRPKRVRESELTWEKEIRIKRLREKYIRIGKVKLQKLYKKEYGGYISQHHISYVIKKLQPVLGCKEG